MNDIRLPYHRLHAFGVAVQFLESVKAAKVRDTKLRFEALKSAKGACCNTAEGAGRVTRADKGRAFTIARAEVCEAAAAVEIAAIAGDARYEDAQRVIVIANQLVGMLTRLIR